MPAALRPADDPSPEADPLLPQTGPLAAAAAPMRFRESIQRMKRAAMLVPLLLLPEPAAVRRPH